MSDGFQCKPARRTVLSILDYSKAYDRVRKELLHQLINTGVPALIIQWFRAFLTDRVAQVRYNGAYSIRVLLCHGLPQGTVSFPLIFLLFMDELQATIPEDVECALFADDVSVWCSDTDLQRASIKVQTALDQIAAWSKAKKMELNVTKSEATTFTPAPKEAKRRPKLFVDGEEIPFNDSPKFLGVHLDRTLSFQKHVEYVTTKTAQRNRILSSLAGKQWGWNKNSLRRVYTAKQRSVLDYAAPAWLPVYRGRR